MNLSLSWSALNWAGVPWRRRAVVGAIAILLAAVVFAPVSSRTVGMRTLENFAHGPVLGCVAVLSLMLIRGDVRKSQWPLWRQYGTAFFVAVMLGGLTELAQMPVGRDASWVDLRSDAIGAAAFLGLSTVLDSRVRGWFMRGGIVTASLILFAVHCVPLVEVAGAYLRRNAAFPVLQDFTQRLDASFMTHRKTDIGLRPLPAPWAQRPGEMALWIKFQAGPWPGVDFFEPRPDWSAYRYLLLDVTNPTATVLPLRLRVNDVRHDNRMNDRFNTRLPVAPMTRQVLRIPLAAVRSAPATRAMDMSNIADLLFFRVSGENEGADQMYLSRVWLE